MTSARAQRCRLCASYVERGFQGRSLLVTAGLPDRDALELIRLGVCGIFHKKNSPAELHRNIKEVAAGKILIDQGYLQNLIESVTLVQDSTGPLTDRDRRVFMQAARGIFEQGNRVGLERIRKRRQGCASTIVRKNRRSNT